MSLSHILAPAPEPAPASTSNNAAPQLAPIAPSEPPRPQVMPPPPSQSSAHDRSEIAVGTPTAEKRPAEEQASPNEPMYTSTTTSTRRNASGSVSSVYSGNKIRHLKKEDGIPLWRKDIQYDFLRLVFYDKTRCFTKYSDNSRNNTFAEIYIDAMAKSSKCSKILKEKLLQDTEGAVCMAMVCLLVNVGRMNTTLNFFPEMRAQLRTYHSIPALQAHQDPAAYKQLQDAPRLKSILKGATEDEPQPSTIDEIRAAPIPRTNPVNLIFVLSQFAPKISEVHFPTPKDFFDLVMKPSLSSASRARAFLWLIWWYLESDFSYEASQRNPFGPGQYADGDKEAGLLPLKVPSLESLNEEQAAAENVDTEEEIHYGEVKRKERIAILASEPSPAMTALKRARKEKGLVTGGGGYPGLHSEDEASEVGHSRHHNITSAGRSAYRHDTASDYTRSPSPAAHRGGLQAVNGKDPGGMRINNLLNNDEVMYDAPQAHEDPGSERKRPGRGNWRRKQDPAGSVPTHNGSQHPRLLPNNAQLNFVNDGPMQTSSNYPNIAPNSLMLSPYRDHVPTPSYQAQKRVRGVTQHQSLVASHRKQQVDYTLDKRIRKIHLRARAQREAEGPFLRAWKRIRTLPVDYDSEEEQIKVRKAKEKAEKDDDWRMGARGRENVDANGEDPEQWRRPRVYLAGYALPERDLHAEDVGEESRSLAKSFRRCSRRLQRWQESDLPGDPVIRRRQAQAQERTKPRRVVCRHSTNADDGYGGKQLEGRRSVARQRSGTGRYSQQAADVNPDDEDGGGELDEEDRELLGEVDADESEDEDEAMGDE